MRKFTYFKTMLLALILLVGSGSAWGQLITEPFNYIADATNGLAKQSSGVWKRFNSGDSILVETGNLSYPSFPTSTGNKVTFGGAGTDYYTSFTSQTSGTVYMSFLLNISALGSLNTTGGYPIGFIDGGTAAFASRLWIRLSGTTNFNLGINAGSTVANTAWASNTLSTATTYLVVVSYNFVTGANNDISKIWINPVLGNSTEPTGDASSTNLSPAVDNTSIQRVFLRQDGPSATPGTMIIDEIRVGTTWASVTPSGISSDATLSVLTLGSGTLSPTFASATTAYTATVSNANSSIDITPTVNESHATVKVNGIDATSGSPSTVSLSVGDNAIPVLVTAQDGSTTKTYTITVTRQADLTPQTITFSTLSPVTYGVSPFTVSATGGASGNPLTFTSSDATIATCTGTNGATVTVLKAGSCTIYADQAGNASYNAALQVGQTLTVNPKELTLPDAAVTSKTYNGNNAAVITGTLTGIINSDDVTLNGTGTFADVNVADGIVVTSTSTLGGTKATNYLLTQPTGLTGNITKADQTITLAATATKYTGDADYSPATSASSAVNPITYISSNTAVATIVSDNIHIIGVGTTTITASQAGNANYNAALDVTQDLTVTNPPAVVTLRPTYIDLVATTSESAVLMTLTNYSSNDARFRIYNGSNQYYPWDESTDTYISSSSYSNGPTVPGTPSTSTTFWILFQRGGNNSATASYRDRLGTGYSSNYQTVALPSATSISSGFALSGNFIGTQTYNNSVKHVVLAYSGTTLISASSTTLSTGAFSVVCPDGTTIDKVEIRAIDNTLIASSTGSWNSALSIGNLPTPTFTGTGDWSETARWSTASVPGTTDNVIVDGDATISSNIEVAGLTINASKSLTVNAGKQLTVSTALTNNGALNLLSDGTNGTATLLTPGTVTTGTGATYNVNQYLPLPRRTWYMSSPVASVSPAGSFVIRSYDEPSNTWGSATLPMVYGIGYSVTPPADGTNNILFTGALNTGEQSITLSRQGSTSQAGFNAVGNPYPSFIDWKAMVTKNTAILETGTMWYRSKETGSFKFYTVDASGVVSPSGSTATAFIPPMQAFWVKTSTDASTLYFEDNMRSHAAGTNPLKAPATKNSEFPLLRLQVSNGINSDEAVIYSYSGATNGYDFYDSPKMMNNDATIPEIYTTLNNQPIVINVMNSLPLNTEIGLEFVPGNATSFSIRANEISNLPSDVKVILKDNANNGTETDLTDGVTTYTFSPATITGNRFSLIFRSAGSVSGIENPDNLKMLVYSNAKNQLTVIYNDALNDASTISVYNAVGQKLISRRMTGTSTVINGTFTPGVYVVKVNNVIRKIIVE